MKVLDKAGQLMDLIVALANLLTNFRIYNFIFSFPVQVKLDNVLL